MRILSPKFTAAVTAAAFAANCAPVLNRPARLPVAATVDGPAVKYDPSICQTVPPSHDSWEGTYCGVQKNGPLWLTYPVDFVRGNASVLARLEKYQADHRAAENVTVWDGPGMRVLEGEYPKTQCGTTEFIKRANGAWPEDPALPDAVKIPVVPVTRVYNRKALNKDPNYYEAGSEALFKDFAASAPGARLLLGTKFGCEDTVDRAARNQRYFTTLLFGGLFERGRSVHEGLLDEYKLILDATR